jgi:hypothetical protein
MFKRSRLACSFVASITQLQKEVGFMDFFGSDPVKLQDVEDGRWDFIDDAVPVSVEGSEGCTLCHRVYPVHAMIARLNIWKVPHKTQGSDFLVSMYKESYKSSTCDPNQFDLFSLCSICTGHIRIYLRTYKNKTMITKQHELAVYEALPASLAELVFMYSNASVVNNI